jgi:hypothetical protein
LSSDIIYKLPIDDPDPKWEEWNGLLTSDIKDIISIFLTSLLDQPSIPLSAILIRFFIVSQPLAENDISVREALDVEVRPT